MRPRKSKNIILTGIKHSGKSTFGKELASKLNYSFYDLDSMIEESNKKNVRVIFKESEKKFRDVEAQAARALSEKMDLENVCAALGGSTVQNKNAMEKLKDMGIFVYLYVELDTLFKRVMCTGVPPFLSLDNTYDDFKSIYKHRDRIHRKSADIIIKLDCYNITEGTERILKSLKNIL